MRKLLLTTAAIAAMATPVVAAPALGGGTSCVRHNDIYNWAAISDKQLVVENYRHQRVLLNLIGTCYGFKFREAIAFRNRGASDLDCISPGDGVFVRDNGLGGRCAVTSVAPFDGPMPSHGPKADNTSDDRGSDHRDHGSY